MSVEVSIEKNQLVTGLEPIRQMFLAQIIYFCFKHDLIDYFIETKKVSARGLAQFKSWNEYRSNALLQYLANEGFFETHENLYLITNRCEEIAPMWPWYRLLVGGYGHTLNDLDQILSDRESYASRNAPEVGVGSCGISQHDALLMTVEMLSPCIQDIDLIVDVGCGDGSFLLDLCQKLPSVRGVGVDPEPESVKSANDKSKELGLSDRVQFVRGSSADIPIEENDERSICFLTAFVLQEILEQDSRSAIQEMIKTRISGRQNRYWSIIEVRNEYDNHSVMRDELALSYYNPYFLIHCLTEQKLEKADFWEELFAESGVSVVATTTTRPSYDDTELKIGYLLSGVETTNAQTDKR